MMDDMKRFGWSLDELARACEAEVTGGELPALIEAVGTDILIAYLRTVGRYL